MIRILDVASMRESDAAAIASGIPGKELMARAGRGIFRAAEWKPPVAPPRKLPLLTNQS